MIISYEFPKCFLKDGREERLSDYFYCLYSRYISDEDYKAFALEQHQKNRTIFLYGDIERWDSSFSKENYSKIIKELQPTYYTLPYVFDKASESFTAATSFYNYYRDLPSIPIVVLQGESIRDLSSYISYYSNALPESALIAIPHNSTAFKNKQEIVGYFTSSDISYSPLRRAINRKLFLKEMASTFEKLHRGVHLLGCNSLAEFDDWGSNFDKSFIHSLSTSHPVAMTLEGPCNYYTWGFFRDEGVLTPMSYYKPNYSVDEHFDDKHLIDNYQLENNTNYFRKKVQTWSEI